ncbi:hypothetical protein GCM10022199_24210 [Marihabitans asiaticum]|uniref:Uncharacterized protein n=1 Tax=Marihabitans asiaticum TaxID=415218 RepID=A0A560W9R0_9MICO|nr:hypothetical protein [Marihabitans asiaticum]TWD14358.1 hypothetical protein FB557_1767 [Marihabitans asiaticum]
MPTTRPRHQITETPAVARALDLAAQRWPGESRGQLLVHLVHEGSKVLGEEMNDGAARRARAVELTSAKYVDLFDEDYLQDLRKDWAE